ncbi:hypothetical protein [Cytobacillus purgationiresistens]|uniref:Uncharacterized protein n=1 Tax=Cytobacillus purgationiresistens TaxID=863449 RepID=A0ABU0AQG8_9BACI|nr:hypothetical protein [Cytobacillus purgationiresistens]MDQ0272285.1 hypothetical protein [Cytobacillus purgationiresistens]
MTFEFYTSFFPYSKIKNKNPLRHPSGDTKLISFELWGQMIGTAIVVTIYTSKATDYAVI